MQQSMQLLIIKSLNLDESLIPYVIIALLFVSKKGGGTSGLINKSLKKSQQQVVLSAFLSSDPGGTRTHDPLIKSQLLYQLSYGVMRHFAFAIAKVLLFY